MRLFFSSDLHLGHFNILRYCNRPFETIEEYNDTVVRNFNERVKDDDLVFHIGDYCFRSKSGRGEGEASKAKEYQSRFKGNWIYVAGNHDRNNSLKTSIESIVIRHGGKRIKLVHKPEFADANYELNFVGHVHEKWQIKRLTEESIMYNVGVDSNNFRPLLIEEIFSNIAKWKRSQNEKTNAS